MNIRYFVVLTSLFLAINSYAAQKDELQLLKAAYLAGDEERVIHLGRAFEEKYPGSTDLPEVLFMMVHVENGYEKKIELLERIKSDFRGSRWAARAHLESGEIFLLKGEGFDAIREFSAIAKRYGNASFYDKALYLLAIACLEEGDYIRARINFKKAENIAVDDSVKKKAIIGIADSHYLAGDYDTSVRLYKKLLKKNDIDDYRAKIMLNLALSHIASDKKEEGLKLLGEILDEYPDSLEAVAASEKMSADVSEDFEAEMKYYLQVGVYSTPGGAEAFKGKLLAMDLDASILPGDVYKVVLGPFDDDIEAKIFGENLKKEEGIESFVIER
jgi:outer membrane protein assembly factor BamD (BamD/ComL family)